MSKEASSSRRATAGAPVAREPGRSATSAGPGAPAVVPTSATAAPVDASPTGAGAPPARSPLDGRTPADAVMGAPTGPAAPSATLPPPAPARDGPAAPLSWAGPAAAGGTTSGSGATKLENAADAPPNTRIICPVPSPKPGVGTGVVIRRAGATAPLSTGRAATSSTLSPAWARAAASAGSVVKGTVAPPAASPSWVTETGTPLIRTPDTASSVFGVAVPPGARLTVTELRTEPIVRGPMTTDSIRLTATATAPAAPDDSTVDVAVAKPTLPPPSLLIPPVARASALAGELVAFRW